MATNQEQIIQEVENILALNGDIADAHMFMALRGRQLSREMIEELARASEAAKRQQSALHTLRKLVAKQAAKDT